LTVAKAGGPDAVTIVAVERGGVGAEVL